MSTDPSDPHHLAFVAQDIVRVGTHFVAEASKYSALMPTDGTQCPFGVPRGGNDQIDRMLETVLRLAGEVHLEITQAIDNHGEKLQSAAVNYISADEITKGAIASVGQLFTVIEEQQLPLPSTPDLPNH